MAIISSKQPPADDEQPSLPKQKRSPKAPASSSKSTPIVTEVLQAEVVSSEEKIQEDSLRPSSIAEYIGQKDLKGILDIAIRAAKVRDRKSVV